MYNVYGDNHDDGCDNVDDYSDDDFGDFDLNDEDD